MKQIITTVGTSLLTHLKQVGELDEQRIEYLNNDINKRKKYDQQIDYIKKTAKKYLESKDLSNNKGLDKMPAEIKSIKKIIDYSNLENYRVHLLYSDTLAGEVVTEILNEYISENAILQGEPYEIKIEGLKVDNRRVFEREGVQNLIDYINQQVINFYNDNLILNITGGFKAVVPYMTLMGNILEIPVYYIFEETDELIILPPVPVNIDEDLFDKYKREFNKLNKNGVFTKKEFDKLFSSAQYEDKQRILQYYIQQDLESPQFYHFNSISQIFWAKYSNNYIFNLALSESARNFYKENQQIAANILNKVSNYQQRKSEKHIHRFTNVDTDLLCFKSGGKEYYRVLYKEKDSKDPNSEVKIAEIFYCGSVHGSDGGYESFFNNPRQADDYTFVPVVIPSK